MSTFYPLVTCCSLVVIWMFPCQKHEKTDISSYPFQFSILEAISCYLTCSAPSQTGDSNSARAFVIQRRSRNEFYYLLSALSPLSCWWRHFRKHSFLATEFCNGFYLFAFFPQFKNLTLNPTGQLAFSLHQLKMKPMMWETHKLYKSIKYF